MTKRRLLPAVALALGLIAPPLGAGEPRSACDWLQLAGAEALLGTGTRFAMVREKSGGGVTLSVCRAEAPSGETLTLLRRTTPDETRPVADLVAAYRADLAQAIGTDPGLTPVDLGDAALWFGEMRQLTIWSHGGTVLSVFSGLAPGAQARQSALAQAILGAGG